MSAQSILLVDDEPLALRPLSRILRHEGYLPECVGSGEDCLDALAARRFDFVVLDLLMPGLTGIDVLRAMKGMPDRPFVVVCSGSGDDLLDAARRLGANAVLPKPLNLDMLLEILQGRRTETSSGRFQVLDRAGSLK